MIARQRLFKNESHYWWLLFAIVFCFVMVMTYIFPRAWSDSPGALNFIEHAASIVPALRFFQSSSQYTSYWGMVYAVFWVISPIFPALGFASTFFLDEEKYKRLTLQSDRKFFGMVCAIVLALISVFLLPLKAPLFDQTSRFLPVLVCGWLITAGAPYGFGWVCGVSWRRRKFKKTNKKEW